ncbi:myeloid differentiation primary response protein MyD88-like [Ostrea edulis]|uniref:myeloid differentiation primary response protein MyD88-like n=1 Tax=Ostrea edulis TaxID=37623 RepID=UPI0024AFC8B0|nr:myeloid differentiation primary response protein MyD88-like [Ostrea edulis]XP_048728834.2 myeloid differentiation primary response protein MyD88-like [Ostrea edulis]
MHKMRAEFDYDAFVICNPDGEDLEFVNSLVDTMQASPYHLKICVPWRVTDRYYCSDEHYIQQRSRSCIVVLSNNFNKSKEAISQLQFAHSLSPAGKERRILPICLDECEVPGYLQQVSKVDFYNTKTRMWLWERLYLSLKSSANPVPDVNLKNLPDVVQ